MNRAQKIKFLNDIKNGLISPEKIRTQLVANGLKADLPALLWVEVSPGIYENEETGRTITDDDISQLYRHEMATLIKMFHPDGTPVPPLAHSEQEVLQRIHLEGMLN